MIYFDNAATTYPKPEEVYKAIDQANRNFAFNSGRGNYSGANHAHEIIEEARSFLCDKGNANNCTFSPSATHAINQIIGGIDFVENDVVICSPYDHNAIARTLYAHSVKKGFTFKLMPLNDDLSIDLNKLKLMCLEDKPKAIFCTHISNVTGYILPIYEIGKIADTSNSLFIVDGAQAFGLINVDTKKAYIDYYVFAGHKTLYGTFGSAGYLSNKNDLSLTLFGGTGTDSLNLSMPSSGSLRYEPSSPNVVAIYGMLVGAKWAFNHNILEFEKELYEYAIKRLKEIDDVILYGINNDCSGIISFNMKGYSSEDISYILSNDFNINVRGGYHCAPFIHDFMNTKDYLGTVRLSFSYFSTKNEIDQLIDALDEISLEG